MHKDISEQIALKRYQIISPVLAEPGRVQNEYFRTQAEREHEFPRYGSRRIAVSTMKGWLRSYRKKGFAGLKPGKRSDAGRPRRVNEAMLTAIRVKCKAYPDLSVQRLYEELLSQKLLGEPPIHYNTLLRMVTLEQLLPAKGRSDVRKRFETENINELWLADFMHGPQIKMGNRTQKSILCAIIDDHSRMIVGYGFHAAETISVLTEVLKEALSTHGIPKRLYVDNGSAFSSDLLARSCAMAGISLIHSKPYDSPSRGKIERFFRTVRERFLTGIQEVMNRDELTEAFALWLRDEYHHKVHSGISERPLDRYHASAGRVHIRRLSAAELDEMFLVRYERIVNNDATISFKGSLYEVPPAYIRQRIEIRHPVDDPQELYLYDNGVRVGRVKLLNQQENASSFRPNSSESTLSFATGRVSK
jgi:transposase InsO family protein